MQQKRTNTYEISILLVFIVTLLFIMPFSTAINNETIENLPEYSQVGISRAVKQRPMFQESFGTDILVTPYVGDNILPSITTDQFDHVVITWTNEQTTNETNWGMAYSNNPTNQQSWFNDQTNVVLSLLDPNPMYFTTAFLNTKEYVGLWGVYISKSDQSIGFYRIPDITVGYQGWNEIYNWDGDFQNPIEAGIVDSNFMYQGKNHPDIIGPWNYYVYHYQGNNYDILNCPVLMRTSHSLDGGVSYFDGQKNQKTAPAEHVDYFNLDENTVHMIIQNGEKNRIIWKKMVMDEQPDIEYTPYQKTIAEGIEPSITGNQHIIAIIYEHQGEIICASSSDDGDHWQFTTIAQGNHPDIVMVGNTLFAAYIFNGNLYKVTSTDGGLTWSDEERVNGVEGTVVTEPRSLDLHKGGIVWVDNRGEDYDIYYAPLREDLISTLQIKEISGGIGVNAVIENSGDTIINNISWSIKLDGTFFFGNEKHGLIERLAPGDSTTISSGFPFGLGNVDIAINVLGDECEGIVLHKQANLFLFVVSFLS